MCRSISPHTVNMTVQRAPQTQKRELTSNREAARLCSYCSNWPPHKDRHNLDSNGRDQFYKIHPVVVCNCGQFILITAKCLCCESPCAWWTGGWLPLAGRYWSHSLLFGSWCFICKFLCFGRFILDFWGLEQEWKSSPSDSWGLSVSPENVDRLVDP